MSFKKYRDLIFGSITLLVSCGYLYLATQIKTRPKLTPSYASAQIVPFLLGGLLALLSVICIIQGIRKMRNYQEDAAAEKNDMVAVLLTFVIIIAYVAALQPLGFCLATIIFLFCQMTLMAPKEKRNFALFAIVSVVFTAVVFVVFRIALSQLLPRGIIESLLGF